MFRIPVLVIVLLVSAVLCGHHAAAQEVDMARRTWMEGYEAMNRADTAVKNGSALAAVKDYESALEVFRTVQQRYPQWNAALIKYRIDYCEKQLAEIRRDNRDNLAFLSREELQGRLSRAVADVQTLKGTLSGVQQRLDESTRSLERSRAEAAGHAALEENFKLIRNERDTLAAQVRLLTAQLATVKDELGEAQKQTPQLQQIPELKRQLAAATSRLSAVNRDMVALAAARDALQEQLRRENLRSEGLSRNAAELQESNRSLNARIAQMQSRLADSDNELLRIRGEMTRIREEAEAQARSSERQAGDKLRNREELLRSSEERLHKAEVQLRNREEQLAAVRGELLTVRRKLELAQDNATRLDEENALLRQRQKNSAEEASRLQSTAAGHEQEFNALQDRTALLQQQEKALKELLQKLEAENEGYRRQIGQLQSRLEEQAKDTAAEKGRNGQLAARIAALQGTLDEVRQQREEEASRLADLQEQCRTLRENENAASAERVALRRQLDETEKQLALRSAALSAVRNETVRLQQELTVVQNSAVENAGDSQRQLRVDSDRALSELRAADGEIIADLRRQVQTRQSELDACKAELSGIKAVVETLQKSLAQSHRQQEDLQQKLTLAETHQQRSKQVNAAMEGILNEAVENARQLKLMQEENQRLQTQLAESRQQLEAAQSQAAAERANVQKALTQGRDETAAVWTARLSEAEKQLGASIKKQQELELALIRRENERRQLAHEVQQLEKSLEEARQATATVAAAPAALPPSPVEAAADPVAPGGRRVTEDTDAASEQEIIVRGYLRQAVAAEHAGRIEAAISNYREALKLKEDCLLALKRLGIIAANAGKDAEAADCLERAVRLDPDDSQALLALGFAQLRLNQPRWALASLARAAAVAPADGQTSRLFATALGAMHWHEAAAAEYRHALSINPKDAEAAYNLALMMLSRASETALAAQNDPQMREALKRYAQYQRREGLKWYRQAVAGGAQSDPALESALQE